MPTGPSISGLMRIATNVRRAGCRATLQRGFASSTKTWQEEHRKAPQAGSSMPMNITKRQRRAIYRCKQRGWLELDIIMGGWAAKNVPKMNGEKDIKLVEDLLEADTPDVLNWVLGEREPPEQYRNEIMNSLQAYAKGDGHVNDR